MTYSEWRKKKREEEEKAALTAQEKAMGGINNASDNIALTSSQFVTFEEWQKNKNGEKDEEESTVVADDSPKTFAEWAKMMSDEDAAQGQILKKPNTTKVDSYEEWRKMKRAEANGETYSRGGNKDAILKSGGFDDGVDGVKDFFGDLFETTAGTLGDAILGIVHGARSGIEGIEDELKYVAAGISDLAGNDAHAERLRTEARRNTVEEEYGWMRNSFDDTSVLGNPADTLMEIGGQQIPALMAGPYGLIVTGVSAAGNATSAAYADIEAMGDAYTGNKDLHAFLYGAGSGVAAALTESITGGLGKGVKALGISRGIGGLDDIVAKKISNAVTKAITNETAQKVLGNTLEAAVKAGGEGLEEVAEGILSAVMKKFTYASNEEWSKLIADEKLLEQFAYGAAFSAIMQGADVVKSTANKTDYVTGMTSAEEKVINKAAEQEIAKREANGEKLTKKQKNEIYDRLSEDISRGYISIDTIEETLGGDKYTEYKKASDENAALKKELDELRNMKSGDMTDIQKDRLNELKAMNLDDTSKIDELKKQMSDDVLKLVKSDRKGQGSLLLESYNEQQRLGQDFVANYDSIKGKKYEDAARKTIDNAIKAGVNNTNKMHDLVDMTAKLSSETGIVYKFGGNEAVKADFIELQNERLAKLEAVENPNEAQIKEIDKIKELIRNVESGETQVNGSISSKGVMLNLDSPKVLSRIVGHEMTHTFENGKHYEGLQKALFTYAKTKGVDIDAKIAEYAEIYKNVSDADAKAELTAELIGDYLFNDYDFIKTLAKDRNVFQRMWDRVKYLAKLATAGSKEQRELARVERMFAKAYQEANATKNTATTKYSFAGENAQVADKGLLAKAEAMVAEGTDAETIRQETGWFKSYDGKWRYEIDDSIAEWHIDTAEPNRHRLLTFGEKIYRLEDLLDHPQLYEAYPQLRDVQVWDNPSHAHGQGNVVGRNTDSMAIGGLTNDTTTKWSILHELQHIIQNIEGFARGSSKYEFTQKEWGDNEYDAFEKRNQVARKLYNILRRHGVSVSNDAIYNEQNYGYGYKVSDDIIENNYWTLNSLAQQNERTQKLVDEYYEQVQILNATTPEGQYHNTAGEIEAYDTMARMRMSAEERKAQRPNIDNPNAIVLGVSEDAVSYISAKDNNNSSIKEQLREHLSEVNEMESVANITYERGNKQKLRSLAVESFKTFGYAVERQNFGTVLIGETQINDSINYLNNDAECAALLAVPKVIKRGIDISGHNNHKGRSYDTYTLAAPVTINGVTGDMAVVIRRTGKNRYYTHRILMPDGSEFIFKEIKKTEPTSADMLVRSDNQGTAIGSAFDDSIPQNSEKSSGLENISDSDLAPTQFSLSENASYAEITEEQQKLYQRERDLEQRKRIANNSPELLQAMDEYHSLFEEMRELLPKRRTGTATQAELDRIEEIKTLRDEKMQQLTELQESLGLSEIAKEEQEIRETKEALRVAADTAWANEGAAKENAAIEKSGLSAEEYFRKKALQAFKTTTNFNEAGYMLPDGKMLNFSGGERNHRYRDHREIGEIYEATQGTDALNRFLNDGNIRIMAESPGIDIAAGVEPTQEQYDTLRRFIKSHGVNEGQFFVDISDADGRRVGQYAYEGRVNAERVINDIKYFYQTGEIREQSSIGQFLSLYTGNDFTPVGSHELLGRDARVQENIAPLTMDNIEAPTSLNSVDNTVGGVDTNVDAADKTETSDIDVSNSRVLKRLDTKLSNSKAELAANEQLREETKKSFDEKIAKAQAELDAKKNKDTQAANAIKRRIERLKRLQADRDVEFAKRIADIKSRITRTESSIQKYHPGLDRAEQAVARIDRNLESNKAALTEEYEQDKADLADKNSYISNKAAELYNEIRNLKKGVRASELLGELLDSGYEWSSIRAALANIKHGIVNQESVTESVAREILNEDYENRLLGLEEDYTNSIKSLEEEARTARENATVAAQRQTKQTQYTEGARGILGDTSTWVDKKLGISYQTNTLRRNLRDIVRDANGKKDIAAADAIYDYLQGTYNHNEAKLKQESREIKQPFANMKINKYESTYAQMLGELRHNPQTTLTKDEVNKYLQNHKDKIDTKKVDKIISEARKVYDDLIRRVNEVLREQGMREIPYRKGYFPHFTEDKQSFLGKLFNWKTKNDDIPTDIAGITETFEPVRSYQGFNKQRTTDNTDYNFKKGLDTYVHGALDWIYHIEDIQKRRAFENEIRYQHSAQGVQDQINKINANMEYDADQAQAEIDKVYEKARNPLNNFVTDFRRATQTLAGKKSSADRQMESDLNRHVYSFMTNISNRTSANMVVGSISSALTNFIPITQSWSQVSPIRTLQAMRDTIRNYVRDDGTIMESDFLTNRLMPEENLDKTTWDKIGEKVGGLMEVVDNFTSQVVWRSKYLDNIKKGMSESQAIANADAFAEGIMAGRSRGNMPTVFDAKNPLSKMLTAFQLEVANQYGYMFKDMPNEIGTKNIGKLVNGYAGMFIGAYVYNALSSALTGRDAAFDPIGILEDLLKDLGFGDDDEEEVDVFGAVSNLAENVAQEIPFVGGLLGGGRVPISSAMPYDLDISELLSDIEGMVTAEDNERYKNSFIKEMLKPVWYLGLPMGGGQIKKTIEGLSMFSDDHPVAGSYTDSGNLRYPVEDTIGNRVQAALFGQYANENARYYFDNDLAPLKENQIQEYMDVGMPIEDYWDYREGLSKLKTNAEKVDYIDSLDLTAEQKNILANNILDRETPVDMTNYGDYSSLEEFDFAYKYPEKYEIAQTVGGYDKYVEYQEGMKGMKLAEKVDYVASLDLTTEQKNALINGETDRKEPIDLTGYENYSSFDEFEYAKNNPTKYSIAKAVGGYDAYMGYSDALNDIKSDKDANGKTINGSRKEKVIRYIDSLDISYGEKIILFRSEYNADDSYNYDIIKYLEAKEDMTYEEKLDTLRALGFTVDKNGYIYW